MNAQIIADLINQNINNLKGGTLKFFGDWFGRPMDNFHRIIRAEYIDNNLVIIFNDDEKLTVTNPANTEMEKDKFIIRCSDHVKWEWYYYGRPKNPGNLFYLDYKVKNDMINCETNVNWYSHSFNVRIDAPAIEIITY